MYCKLPCASCLSPNSLNLIGTFCIVNSFSSFTQYFTNFYLIGTFCIVNKAELKKQIKKTEI